MGAKGIFVGVTLLTLGAVAETQFEGVSKTFGLLSGASGKISGLASNEDPAVTKLKAKVGDQLESLPLPSFQAETESYNTPANNGDIVIVPEARAPMTSFAFIEDKPNERGLASHFQNKVLAFDDDGQYQVASARMSVEGVEYNGILTNVSCGYNRVFRYGYDCVPVQP